MTQGVSPSNTSAGVKTNNMQLIDLTPNSSNGLITGIRIFWLNSIAGLEFAFGGNTTGIIKGNLNANPWEDKLDLLQGDYIVEVFGRYTNVITCFGFRTAKGFNRVWGNPLEGESFKFMQGGHYIQALKIGVTDYISYLEPVYEDEAFAHAKKVDLSQNGKFTNLLGKSFSDTETFDDWEWLENKFNYAVAEIKVWHDGKFVHGVQFHYHLDGTKKTPGKHCTEKSGLKCESLVLNENEHITKVLLRAGDMIDHIVFYTDQGRKVGGGGNGGVPLVAVLQPMNQFVAVGGGIGGHLHNLRLFYDEIY